MEKCKRCGKTFLIEECKHGLGENMLCDECIETIVEQYITEFHLRD